MSLKPDGPRLAAPETDYHNYKLLHLAFALGRGYS